MDLRDKVVKLVEGAPLPQDERAVLLFVLETYSDGPLKGVLFPDVESHINGRYEWYFLPCGTLRRSPHGS